MFVPTLTHTQMFYRRQLFCYNVAVSARYRLQSYMFMWDKSIAGRGGNEIASCMLKVLNTGITMEKNLIVRSDNCAAQNKNRMMVSHFLFLVANGLFTQTKQRFLVSGHSFLHCDSKFALIERRKLVTKAFVLSDLCKIIEEARAVIPFRVMSMNISDFFNIQVVADEMLATKKLNISKDVSIIYDSTDVALKECFTDMERIHLVNVLKNGKHARNIQSATSESISSVHSITDEKKKDLMAMISYLEKNEHKEYYMQICGESLTT